MWKSLVFESRVLELSWGSTIHTGTQCWMSGKCCLFTGVSRSLFWGVEWGPAPMGGFTATHRHSMKNYTSALICDKTVWSLDMDFLWLPWPCKASVKDPVSQGTYCPSLLLKAIASGTHALRCDVSESWAQSQIAKSGQNDENICICATLLFSLACSK